MRAREFCTRKPRLKGRGSEFGGVRASESSEEQRPYNGDVHATNEYITSCR